MPEPPDDQREPPRGGLVSFLGERYPRSWVWRDSLGCVWLPAFAVVLTVAILLGQLGVPSRVIQIGTVVVLAALIVALWLLGRTKPDDE